MRLSSPDIRGCGDSISSSYAMRPSPPPNSSTTTAVPSVSGSQSASSFSGVSTGGLSRPSSSSVLSAHSNGEGSPPVPIESASESGSRAPSAPFPALPSLGGGAALRRYLRGDLSEAGEPLGISIERPALCPATSSLLSPVLSSAPPRGMSLSLSWNSHPSFARKDGEATVNPSMSRMSSLSTPSANPISTAAPAPSGVGATASSSGGLAGRTIGPGRPLDILGVKGLCGRMVLVVGAGMLGLDSVAVVAASVWVRDWPPARSQSGGADAPREEARLRLRTGDRGCTRAERGRRSPPPPPVVGSLRLPPFAVRATLNCFWNSCLCVGVGLVVDGHTHTHTISNSDTCRIGLRRGWMWGRAACR
eukprot:m.233978 g.233978  ORF g.233978 m.233978 type:complete len:363 (-) comp26108_c0_seq2:1100-2188(-)